MTGSDTVFQKLILVFVSLFKTIQENMGTISIYLLKCAIIISFNEMFGLVFKKKSKFLKIFRKFAY